jgi:hypothetical protein
MRDPREVQAAARLLFRRLAKSVRRVVREEGDSVNDKRHKQHLQRPQLPIVETFVRTSPSYSRNKFD